MELTIHEETWPYIDELFRTVPEAMQKVSTFQEALEKSEDGANNVGYYRPNKERYFVYCAISL
ncbi:MAG: hypothetical protein R3C14_30555 [Caldilineaceae bacterium]